MRTKNCIVFAFNYRMPIEEELSYVQHIICSEAEQILGVYKGSVEMSYVCPVHSDIDFKALRRVLKLTEQESMLFVSICGEATLIFSEDDYRHTDNSEYLGHLVEVTKEEAMLSDSYSLDPEENKYYICK